MSAFVREAPITFLRTTEGVLDKSTGRYGPSTEVEVILVGNIQPAQGEDLNRAPEGARLEELKVIFLHSDLDEKDVLLLRGKRYQIQKTDEWYPEFSTLPHFRFLAELEGDRI